MLQTDSERRKLRKQQAREREIQAKEMREEHRRQTLAIIEEQQRQVEIRRQQMKEKDDRRIAEMQARQVSPFVTARFLHASFRKRT